MADQLDLFDVRGPSPEPRAETEPETDRSRDRSDGGRKETPDAPLPAEAKDTASASEKEMLRRRLGRRLGLPVTRLVLTENRTRMLSARPEGEGLYLRIHRAFVHGDEETLDAVAVLCDRRVRGGARRDALQVARSHFRLHAEQGPPRRKALTIYPVGETFDLRILRDRVNEEYFGGELEVHVTWGRRSSARSRRRRRSGIHIRLGSYDQRHRLVRVHPVLDRPEVPEYVVESIVHHEMLHAAVPPVPGRTRRRVHTKEFRRREREFRRHDEAEAWIETHLETLDRWRREG